MIDLDAIEARHKAATPGPWREMWSGYVVDPDNAILFETRSEADTDFVIHAREDVPALAAEVRLLQYEKEQLKEIVHDLALRSAELLRAAFPVDSNLVQQAVDAAENEAKYIATDFLSKGEVAALCKNIVEPKTIEKGPL
jgi:hypothetical protein